MLFFVGRKLFTRSQLALGIISSILIFPLIYLFALFPAIYSTCNLIGQELFSSEFWKYEFANGMFAVRVATYLLTIHFVISIYRYHKSRLILFTARLNRGVTPYRAMRYGMEMHPDEFPLWAESDLDYTSALQFAFYLGCVQVLWLVAIQNLHSLVTSITSWCLFFIIDDWVIIADYTSALKRSPLTKHYIKILAFNFALALLITSISVMSFNWAIRIPIVAFMSILLLYICRLSWRSKLSFNDSVE